MDPNSRILMLGAASGEETYWMRHWSSITDRSFGALMIDAAGDLVTSGYDRPATVLYPMHWKLDLDGNIIYSLKSDDYPPADSTTQYITQLPSGGNYIFTNGSYRTVRDTSFGEVARTSTSVPGGPFIDSSGNSYGSIGFSFFSLDSNLNTRWAKERASGRRVALLSNNNVVLFGIDGLDAKIIIFDSSNGSVISAYKSNSPGVQMGAGVGDGTIDANDNMYWFGHYGSSGGLNSIVFKLNSSGTVLWQYYQQARGSVVNLAVDNSNGDVYFITSSSYLYKLDSSGTFQWCRQLNGVGSPTEEQCLLITSSAIFLSHLRALIKIPKNPPISAGTYNILNVAEVAEYTSSTINPVSWSSDTHSVTNHTVTTGIQYGTYSNYTQVPTLYTFT